MFLKFSHNHLKGTLDCIDNSHSFELLTHSSLIWLLLLFIFLSCSSIGQYWEKFLAFCCIHRGLVRRGCVCSIENCSRPPPVYSSCAFPTTTSPKDCDVFNHVPLLSLTTLPLHLLFGFPNCL